MPVPFRVQVVKNRSFWTGQRSVKNFLDKICRTFIGFCHIRHAVGIPFDKLFIAAFSAAGNQDDFLANRCLDIQAITLFVLPLTAASLKKIFHAETITVQHIDLCCCCGYPSDQVNPALVPFQSGAECQCVDYVLPTALSSLGYVQPMGKSTVKIIFLIL